MNRTTREVRIGNIVIGGDNPIAVQSMAATRTQDIDATIRQVQLLEKAGADVIRIAVDNPKDVASFIESMRLGYRVECGTCSMESLRVHPDVLLFR